MTLPTNTIPQIIEYFQKVVIDGDLAKLMKVARDTQDEWNRSQNSSYTSEGTPMTTRSIEQMNSEFISGHARCAVPIATSLLSTIQFFGRLINSGSDDFPNNFRSFLNYRTRTYSNEEIDVISAVYRNGMMHGFFPKGVNIEIEFDAYSNPTTLRKQGNIVVFNVFPLYLQVKSFLVDLHDDTERHPTMLENYSKWKDEDSRKHQNFVDEYKKSILRQQARNQ